MFSPAALKALDRPLSLIGMPSALLANKLMASTKRPEQGEALIIRPGGMGDLILLCIACEELGLPPQQLYWLIESRSAKWARHLGLRYLCYDGQPTACLALAAAFATVINTEQYFGLAQSAGILARAPGGKLVCFSTNRGSAWADMRVAYDPGGTHESIQFSRLLYAGLGLSSKPLASRPIRQRRVPATRPPVVGIAGLQSSARRFSLDEWFGFVRSWAGLRDFVVCPTAVDEPFARELCSRLGKRATLFQGEFPELCELISSAEDVFTVDGGFLHIASYYGVPATAVFTAQWDEKWAPLGNPSFVIRRRDLKCQPCARFAQVPPCRFDYRCRCVDYSTHTSQVV